MEKREWMKYRRETESALSSLVWWRRSEVTHRQTVLNGKTSSHIKWTDHYIQSLSLSPGRIQPPHYLHTSTLTQTFTYRPNIKLNSLLIWTNSPAGNFFLLFISPSLYFQTIITVRAPTTFINRGEMTCLVRVNLPTRNMETSLC